MTDTLVVDEARGADDLLAVAREQVLERGVGLDEAQVLAVLQLPDDGTFPRCSPSRTRCGCAGAAPRSRSRASCR